jgi:hypothetical protein
MDYRNYIIENLDRWHHTAIIACWLMRGTHVEILNIT